MLRLHQQQREREGGGGGRSRREKGSEGSLTMGVHSPVEREKDTGGQEKQAVSEEELKPVPLSGSNVIGSDSAVKTSDCVTNDPDDSRDKISVDSTANAITEQPVKCADGLMVNSKENLSDDLLVTSLSVTSSETSLTDTCSSSVNSVVNSSASATLSVTSSSPTSTSVTSSLTSSVTSSSLTSPTSSSLTSASTASVHDEGYYTNWQSPVCCVGVASGHHHHHHQQHTQHTSPASSLHHHQPQHQHHYCCTLEQRTTPPSTPVRHTTTTTPNTTQSVVVVVEEAEEEEPFYQHIPLPLHHHYLLTDRDSSSVLLSRSNSCRPRRSSIDSNSLRRSFHVRVPSQRQPHVSLFEEDGEEEVGCMYCNDNANSSSAIDPPLGLTQGNVRSVSGNHQNHNNSRQLLRVGSERVRRSLPFRGLVGSGEKVRRRNSNFYHPGSPGQYSTAQHLYKLKQGEGKTVQKSAHHQQKDCRCSCRFPGASGGTLTSPRLLASVAASGGLKLVHGSGGDQTDADEGEYTDMSGGRNNNMKTTDNSTKTDNAKTNGNSGDTNKGSCVGDSKEEVERNMNGRSRVGNNINKIELERNMNGFDLNGSTDSHSDKTPSPILNGSCNHNEGRRMSDWINHNDGFDTIPSMPPPLPPAGVPPLRLKRFRRSLSQRSIKDKRRMFNG